MDMFYTLFPYVSSYLIHHLGTVHLGTLDVMGNTFKHFGAARVHFTKVRQKGMCTFTYLCCGCQ